MALNPAIDLPRHDAAKTFNWASLAQYVLFLAVAAAVLGPLVLEVIEFRTSAHIENQFVGGEVVTTQFTGAFKTDRDLQRRFLDFCNRK